MHSSTLLSAAFAGMALASPLFQLDARDYEYDVLTVVETVTVLDYGSTTVTEFPTTATSGSAASGSAASYVTSVKTVVPSASSSAVPSSTLVEVLTSVVSSPVAASSSVAPSSSAAATTVAAPAKASSKAVASSSSVVVVASSSTVAASTSSPTDFESTVVYHHNLHRSNHSAPSASYDSDLASYAATVAASCTFAHDLTPGGGGYGQNIADYGSTGDVEALGSEAIVAQAITNLWYNGEVNLYLDSYYGESTPDMTDFEEWGHFSQLVWVDSTKVGCAAQYCEAGTLFSDMAGWFTVCNYGSAGNVDGEYGTNVLPSVGDSTVTA